jgi:hypothetical protein
MRSSRCRGLIRKQLTSGVRRTLPWIQPVACSCRTPETHGSSNTTRMAGSSRLSEGPGRRGAK